MQIDNNIPSLQKLFSKKIQKIIDFIIAEGFIITLVGGTVRDYFLTSEIGDDLDFELRFDKEYQDEKWKRKIRALAKEIQNKFEVDIEYFDFGIFRFHYEGKDFEFASPRIEEFDNRKKKLGHKDFKVKLFSNLNYQEGFKRRDFSINAIGIEISSKGNLLVDPMKGTKDLKNKVLNPCSDHFFKDPVRFLRLVRFKIKTGFKVGEKIKKNMGQFNLEKLSHTYILKESFKSLTSKFYKEMFNLVYKYKIPVSEKISSIKPMEKITTNGKCPRDILKQMVFLHDFSHDEIWAYSDFAGSKKSYLKNILSIKEFSDYIEDIDLKGLIKTAQNSELETILDQENFNKLAQIISLIKRSEELYHECEEYFSKPLNKKARFILELKKRNRGEIPLFDEIPAKKRKIAELYYLLNNSEKFA